MILILKKTIITFVSGALLTLLAGCSAYKEFVTDKKITIERIHSNTARVTRARLHLTENNKTILRGDLLLQQTHFKGKIPGHLHVELINFEGAVFKKTEASYQRKNHHSRLSVFFISIPVEPALISSVRVIHHDLRSHIANSEKSSWIDVNEKNR